MTTPSEANAAIAANIKPGVPGGITATSLALTLTTIVGAISTVYVLLAPIDSPTFTGTATIPILALTGAPGTLALGNQSYAPAGNMRQDWLLWDGTTDPKSIGTFWPVSTYAWQTESRTVNNSTITGQGTPLDPINNGPLFTRFTIIENTGAHNAAVAAGTFSRCWANNTTCFGGNDIVFGKSGFSTQLVGREIDLEWEVGATDAGGSIGLPMNVFSIASNATAMQVGGVGGGTWGNGFITQNIRGSHYAVNSGDSTTAASFINTVNGTFSNAPVVLGRGVGQSISFGGLGFGTSPLLFGDGSNNAVIDLGSTDALIINDHTGVQLATVTTLGANVATGKSYSIGGTTMIDNAAWSTYSPTVTSLTGTITTLGAVVAKRKSIGKTTFVNFTVPITTNGTGATAVRVTMPNTPSAAFSCSGVETTLIGAGLQVRGSTSGYVDIYTYNSVYPGGSGSTIIGTCAYEAN